MVTSDPSSPSTSAPSRSCWAWSGIVFGGRALAVTFTVLLGIFIVQTLATVLYGPGSLLPPAPTKADPTTALAVTVHEGTWQIAGSPSLLGAQPCPATELNSKLDAWPNDSMSPLPLTPRMRRIANTMTVDRKAKLGLARYSTDEPRYRLRIFTTGSGTGEQWLVFRVATASETGDWVIAEFRAGVKQSQTFPVPAGGNRLATRIGSDQQVQAELIGWTGNADEIRTAVIAAGWEASENSPNGFACRQGERTAWVWVWPGNGPERIAMVAYGTPPKH